MMAFSSKIILFWDRVWCSSGYCPATMYLRKTLTFVLTSRVLGLQECRIMPQCWDGTLVFMSWAITTNWATSWTPFYYCICGVRTWQRGQCTYRGQSTALQCRFYSSTFVWILYIELRLSVAAANAFIHRTIWVPCPGLLNHIIPWEFNKLS